MAAIPIDIVSDVVCPWCYVGKRRLDRALALAPEVPVAVRWRPYFLNPGMPQGGMPRAEYLAMKFGGAQEIDDMHQRLVEAGAQENIPFAFEKIEIQPNTTDAHRLILWAGQDGRANAMVERLFSSHFIEGGRIGDKDHLGRLAGEVGMDAERVRARLEGDDDLARTGREVDAARGHGVHSVPTFIFASLLAVSGAHQPEVLVTSLRRAVVEREKYLASRDAEAAKEN